MKHLSEYRPHQVHRPRGVEDGATDRRVGEGARLRDDGRHDRGADVVERNCGGARFWS